MAASALAVKDEKDEKDVSAEQVLLIRVVSLFGP
jgi:hypothetical protein